MKPVNRAMKDHPAYNRQTVYLFFFDQGTDAAVAGYMPLNGQFGFVFTGAVGNDAMALARTTAHELAHGTFNLRHTFSPENEYVLSEGSTDNLMDYPSAGSGLVSVTEATRLNKYQWNLIHNPKKIWFAWLEEKKETQYVDENCFKDPSNYAKFKFILNSLKENDLFIKVFDILKNPTKLAYCFDELTIDEINEIRGENKLPGGITFPVEKATFIGMRNIKTHQKYWINQVLKIHSKEILDYIKSEDWKGRIGLNMSLVSSYIIFHELNHAVQNLLELEGKAQYSEALKKVETRMICFYAAFLKADVETRKDYLKMREFLKNFYADSNLDDLLPLTGTDLLIEKFSETSQILSEEEIYTIIYKFFSGFECNDFNKIMKEYAKYIKESYRYKYNPDEFKPDYYLFNLIKIQKR